MRVLQTLALPLGYRADRKVYSHDNPPGGAKSNPRPMDFYTLPLSRGCNWSTLVSLLLFRVTHRIIRFDAMTVCLDLAGVLV